MRDALTRVRAERKLTLILVAAYLAVSVVLRLAFDMPREADAPPVAAPAAVESPR